MQCTIFIFLKLYENFSLDPVTEFMEDFSVLCSFEDILLRSLNFARNKFYLMILLCTSSLELSYQFTNFILVNFTILSKFLFFHTYLNKNIIYTPGFQFLIYCSQ